MTNSCKMQRSLFKISVAKDSIRVSWYLALSVYCSVVDEVAEWLRRWTANPLGSARVGSNPILVGRLRFYGVMVSTLDFESSDPSSNLGRTSPFFVLRCAEEEVAGRVDVPSMN